MSIPRAFIKASVAVALASVTSFTTSAFGQSLAGDSKPKDLPSEIEAVKAENAVIRELLRKMAEQQRILLEQVDRLQRRLDGGRQPMCLSAASQVYRRQLQMPPCLRVMSS